MTRSTSTFHRAGLSLILALIISICVLAGLDLRQADAQTYNPQPGMDPAEEAYRFRKWLERTKPSAFAQGNAPPGQTFTTAQQAEANQKVLTKSARSRLVGLGPHVLRAGLAGVAAGVWTHNGISLYNGWQCGKTTCPDPLILDSEFRQAQETSTSAGAGGAVITYKATNGDLLASAMVTTARYQYDSATKRCTRTVTWAGQFAAGINQTGAYGWINALDDGSGINPKCGGTVHIGPSQPFTLETSVTLSSAPSSAARQRFGTQSREASGTLVTTSYGPSYAPTESSVYWENPVYDIGETSLIEAPLPGTYEASGAQSHDMFNDIQQTTAAPEAPPETTPETAPDYFPQEWEEEFPDVGEPGKQDDPYGDPDEDGQPNHADPDDDEDGIPDEDDEQPFGNPVELPSGDPDGDGIPNRDDPDDDGDSIPDEDDPQPFTPTDPATLPQDHPYADPDEDGQPNRDDTDDDGDGIPDEDDPQPFTPTDPATLPQDHPYADPDEDGQPNRDDTDDDGDGTPDTDDPSPFDPTIPERDPSRDRDADDVPDTIDPYPDDPAKPSRYTRADRDGDFSPDNYDPAPDDPAMPQTEPGPTSDTDADGVPNQHDPFPEDSANPRSDPDLDGDTVPNQNDPDPYRRDQPEGGPTSDPDGDGYTNEEDPFPQDENLPENQAEKSVCPIAKKPNFDLPELNIGNLFPFSLIIFAFQSFGELAGGSQTPCFDIPLLGGVCVPSLPFIGAIRPTIAVVGTCGMCFWFYRYISGKGGSNEG